MYIEQLIINEPVWWEANQDWLIICPNNDKTEQHEHLVKCEYEYVHKSANGGDDDIFIIHRKTKKFSYAEFGDNYSRIWLLESFKDIYDFVYNT